MIKRNTRSQLKARGGGQGWILRTNVDELVEVLKKNKGWQGRRTHGAMNIKDKWAWSRSQDLHKTYEYFYWFSWGFA